MISSTPAAHEGGSGRAPLHVRLPNDSDRQYYVHLPPGCEGRQPLVLVHGISRNAAELVLKFGPFAEELGVPLIAPVFLRDAYGMYQQVLDPRRRTRADLALLDVLSDAAERWALEVSRVPLFGFSGGGQFAHRFTMLHPHRVSACVPVSAGWYCWPDPGGRWPLGLADAPVAVDWDSVARVPMHIIAGARDRDQDEALRRSPAIDQLQGSDRVERARRWHRAMLVRGMRGCTLTILPGARHNFRSANRHGLVPLVFSLLGYALDAACVTDPRAPETLATA